jgi:hypothetical protein
MELSQAGAWPYEKRDANCQLQEQQQLLGAFGISVQLVAASSSFRL